MKQPIEKKPAAQETPSRAIYTYLQEQGIEDIPKDYGNFYQQVRESEEIRNNLYQYLSSNVEGMVERDEFDAEFQVPKLGDTQGMRPLGAGLEPEPEPEPLVVDRSEPKKSIRGYAPTPIAPTVQEPVRDSFVIGDPTAQPIRPDGSPNPDWANSLRMPRKELEEITNVVRGLPTDDPTRKLGAYIVKTMTGERYTGYLNPGEPNPSIRVAVSQFMEEAEKKDNFTALDKSYRTVRENSIDERDFQRQLRQDNTSLSERFLLPDAASLAKATQVAFSDPAFASNFDKDFQPRSMSRWMPEASPKERLNAYNNMLLSEYYRLAAETGTDYIKSIPIGVTGETEGQASFQKDRPNDSGVLDALDQAAKMWFGMSPADKRQYQVVAQLAMLAPIVTSGVDPLEVVEPDGTTTTAFKNMYGLGSMDQAGMAGTLMQVYSAAGVDPEEEYKKRIDEKAKVDLWEATKGLIGTSAAIGTQIALSNKLIGKSNPLSDVRNKSKFMKWATVAAENMLDAGIRYEIAGQLSPSDRMKDELNFGSGLFGGLGQAVFSPAFSALQGKLNNSFSRFIARRTGSGVGEMSEETFQTVYQTISQSPDFNKAKESFDQQFGTVSDASFFFISSFMMGFAMGGSDMELSPAKEKAYNELLNMQYDGLSEKDKEEVKPILDELKKATTGEADQQASPAVDVQGESAESLPEDGAKETSIPANVVEMNGRNYAYDAETDNVHRVNPDGTKSAKWKKAMSKGSKAYARAKENYLEGQQEAQTSPDTEQQGEIPQVQQETSGQVETPPAVTPDPAGQTMTQETEQAPGQEVVEQQGPVISQDGAVDEGDVAEATGPEFKVDPPVFEDETQTQLGQMMDEFVAEATSESEEDGAIAYMAMATPEDVVSALGLPKEALESREEIQQVIDDFQDRHNRAFEALSQTETNGQTETQTDQAGPDPATAISEPAPEAETVVAPEGDAPSNISVGGREYQYDEPSGRVYRVKEDGTRWAKPVAKSSDAHKTVETKYQEGSSQTTQSAATKPAPVQQAASTPANITVFGNEFQYDVPSGRVYSLDKDGNRVGGPISQSRAAHRMVVEEYKKRSATQAQTPAKGPAPVQQTISTPVQQASAPVTPAAQPVVNPEPEKKSAKQIMRIQTLQKGGLSSADAERILKELDEGELSDKGLEIKKSPQIKAAISQSKDKELRALADAIWKTPSKKGGKKSSQAQAEREARQNTRNEVDTAITSGPSSVIDMAKEIYKKFKKKIDGDGKSALKAQIDAELNGMMAEAATDQAGDVTAKDARGVFNQIISDLGFGNEYAGLIERIMEAVTFKQAQAFGFDNKGDFAEAIASNIILDRKLREKGAFTSSMTRDNKADHYATRLLDSLNRKSKKNYSHHAPSGNKIRLAGPGSIPSRFDRIPADPITGMAPTRIRETLKNLRKGLGLNMIFSKVRSKFKTGSYEGWSDMIKLRYQNDLNTLSHELGHVLSSRYNIVKKVLDGEIDTQVEIDLNELSKTGSEPAENHPNPRQYRMEEGFAEFMSLMIVNPSAVAKEFPALHQLYSESVPSSAKDAVKAYSNDVRILLGATALDRHIAITAPIPNSKKEAEALVERTSGLKTQAVTASHKARLEKMGMGLYLNTVLFDAMAPVFNNFNKMLIYHELGEKNALGKVVRDWNKINPSQDVLVLARTFLGFHGRMQSMFENGLETGVGKIATENGQNITLHWMMEVFDNLDATTVRAEMDQTAAVMIAQRVVEFMEKPENAQGPPPTKPGDVVVGDFAFRLVKGAPAKGGKSKRTKPDRIYMVKRDGELRQQPIPMKSDLHDAVMAASSGATSRPGYAAKSDAVIGGEVFRIAETPYGKNNDKVKRRVFRVGPGGKALAKPVPLSSDISKLILGEPTSFLSAKPMKDPASVASGAGIGYFEDFAEAKKVKDEFDALAKSDPDKHARLTEAMRRYRVTADVGLKYMVSQGRMSAEEYATIKANNEQYVAMNRVMSVDPDDHSFSFGGIGSNIADARNPIKEFKGSGREINNPYMNLMAGLFRMYRETDRNSILQSFTRLSEFNRDEYGDAIPEELRNIAIDVTAYDNEETGRGASPGVDRNVVAVFENGEKKYYQLDEEVYRSFTAMYDYGKSIPGGFRIFSDVLKNTITNAPTFAARNFIRDTLTRMSGVQATSGKVPILSDALEPGKAFATIFTQKHKDDFERFGGAQGGYYHTDPGKYYLRMLEVFDQVDNKWQAKLNPKNWWENYQNFLSRFENANRLREYKRAYDEGVNTHGMSEYEAKLYGAYKARDLMDFAVGGEWSLWLNKVIPFFNPSVRGIYRTYEAVQDSPGRFMGNFLAYSVFPTIALRMMIHLLGEDEDYKNIPAYQRDMFFNIPMPDGWITIPKPHDMGVISSGIERMTSSLLLGEEYAWDGYGGSLTQLVGHPELIYGPAPTIVENWANYNFFRQKHIVPTFEEGRRLGLKKGRVSAGIISKTLSEALAATGWEAAEVDPRKIDNFMLGQFGYFGEYLVRGTNTFVGDGNELRTYGSFADFVRRFSGVFKEDAYYTSNDVQWVMKKARREALEQRAEYAQVKDLMQLHFNAPPEHKKMTGEALVKAAGLVRKGWAEVFDK